MDRPGDFLNEPAARFAAEIGRLCRPEDRLGLAVSGGPDSLALLLLASKSCAGRVAAATVDHGLRAQAADEAAAVAALGGELEVPHATLRVQVGRGASLQAEARAARYHALGRWARENRLDAIVTAHHADDQAETLLMRLNRGAGLGGLAAMRPRSVVPGTADLPLLRPLLGWRRVELAELVAKAGWQAADDPSNAELRFDRVRARTLLSSADWLDPARLAAAAGHLQKAEDALAWAVARELDQQVTFDAQGSALYRPQGPQAIRFGVVREVVARIGSEGTPQGPELSRLVETLEAGGIATLAGLRAHVERGGAWRFVPAPRRRRSD